MNPLNELAILLASKIIFNLEDVGFLEKREVDEMPSHNFYQVRESILSTLNEYVEVFFQHVEFSPEQMERMPPANSREGYLSYLSKKRIETLCSDIYEKGAYKRDVFEADGGWRRSETDYIAVINLRKLQSGEK